MERNYGYRDRPPTLGSLRTTAEKSSRIFSLANPVCTPIVFDATTTLALSFTPRRQPDAAIGDIILAVALA